MLLRVPLIKFPKWTHLSPNSYWFPFYGRKSKGTYRKIYRKFPIMKKFTNLKTGNNCEAEIGIMSISQGDTKALCRAGIFKILIFKRFMGFEISNFVQNCQK